MQAFTYWEPIQDKKYFGIEMVFVPGESTPVRTSSPRKKSGANRSTAGIKACNANQNMKTA
jgi:hypothetical protein